MKLRLLIAVVAGICMLAKGADETPPTIVQVQPAPGTVNTLTNITVHFSEQIEGISTFDFLVNGQMADAISGADETYTFYFPQPTHGTVLITWDINHTIVDSAGNRFNENGPGATWQYNFVDNAPPVVTLLTPGAGLTVRQLSQIDVQFNEAVSGIDAADLLINGTPAASINVLGQGRYRFAFPQPGQGTVQVAWAANHQIRDFASPPNAFAGGSWTYILDPTVGLPDVRINEFLAANASGLKDENNEFQDWIEIQNRGSAAVNLAGWSLTDDPNDPGKWVFPSTNVAAGQYLVVFASGKDRRVAGGTNRLHTNFQLNSGGGYLALFNGESPRLAMTEFVDFPVQRNDYSYGYDSNQVLKYFSVPTPGAANAGSQISGIVSPPHFSVDRGWFETPFTLYLSCPDPGATIRYTMDGSDPTAANGINYAGPMQISNTMVLRAIATKANMLPSSSLIHTYLFLAEVLNQPMNPPGFLSGPGFPLGPTNWQGYPTDFEMDPEIVTNSIYGPQVLDALKALPSVSIASSVYNLFDITNGIYTHTAESATAFRGTAWERPCSVEFIPTNNAGGFQANCGIRMQGNASRNPQKTPKHPMRLLFKGDYGPNRLDEKVYPDSPVRSFNTLVMRADFNNSWCHWDPNQRLRGTRIRDAWTKDTWRDMGQPGSHSRYFHLFINGLYWGIYDFGERVDATFAANYLGGQPEEYDVIASKPVEATDGDLVAYNAMSATIRNNDQRFFTNYLAVLNYLDVPNFADYMLLNFYGANQDWGNDSNWNALRRRSPDGRFKYIAWDGEQLIVATNDNRVSNTDVPGGLHTSLVNSPEYRLTFADRAQKHLFNNGALTPGPTAQRWSNRMAEVQLAIIAETARWGDYRRDMHQYQTGPYFLYTKNDHWMPEVNRLLTNYFPMRTAILLGQLRAAGLYPSHAAPVFSQHGGRVPRNYALTITATNNIYYTLDGSDPREFGTSAIASGAVAYSGAAIVLSNSVIVKARALFDTNWSALAEATFQVAELGPTIRITEIMYNPVGGDAYEYLVLKNVGTAPLNLGGYSFDGINYIFAPGAVIAAGASIVLASDNNPTGWASRYPSMTAFGFFGGNLSNGGEKISIKDPDGNIVYSLDYDDENGWDTAADGRGPPLKVVDALADPDDPANWSSAAPAASAVVLNEVLAASSTSSDWVELRNTSGVTVNLGGWSITDDSNARKYVFPGSVSIPADGYLVVWCDNPTNTAPGPHTGFALSRNGETVSLFNATTTRVDVITFGLQLGDYSVGRTASGWKLNTPTPGAANIAAATASTGNLSINEWLANAPPGGSDWIELFNRSSSAPVALQGIFVGNGRTVHQLNSLSFIAPQGFVQLFATELAGPDQLDFKLSAAGGAIVLYDESAIELERVTYGPQTESITQGRLPDGTSTIATFTGSASPGANNYVINYNGPILNEIAAGLGWVELRNPNGAPADISGMRLTTDLADPAQYIFPAGTTVSGNGYLVVTLGELLNDESGAVYLLNTNGQVVDSVVYGFQVPDLSIGRSGSQWQLLQSVTPGYANAAAAQLGSTMSLRINEWLANPAEGNDWFELYNSDSSSVALAGLYATDNPSIGGLRQFQFPPLSFIGAKGFVRVIADGDPSDGRNHVNFNLAAEGESLRLVAGDTIIDSVYFGAQELNVSQGRIPDGGPDVVSFPQTPTPRASNYLPLENARIDSVHQHLLDGVEIYNPSTLGVDLSGWFLSDDPLNYKAYRIPDGTFLPGGGYRFFDRSESGIGIFSYWGGVVFLSEADAAGNLSGRRSIMTYTPFSGYAFGIISTCTGTDSVQLEGDGYMFNGPFRPSDSGIVINEIMYHPAALSGNENNIDEYIELYNLNDYPRELYGFQLRNAVAFDFPSNSFIPPHGFVVIVGFDPAADLGQLALFRIKFNVPEEAAVFGPWRGNLANAGERVELMATVPLQYPWDAIGYDDSPPWPISGDGDGNSLQRIDPQTHGNDALNWQAAPPTPGQANAPASVRAPIIVVQPVSRAVPPGGPPQSFNVVVCGSEPITYQWRFNGQDIPGATQKMFTRYTADPTNAGIYEVHVSNAAGTILSAPAYLAIQSPPVITQHPQPVVAPSGTSASFTVAASGTGPLTYQWRKNGVIIPGATNDTLQFASAQVGDDGDYSALVRNAAGVVASHTANLEVFRRVRVLTHPQSRTVNTNTAVGFTVTAEGAGTLRYQWRYFGDDMPGETNATLTLPSVQLEQSGEYTVFVYDQRSSAESLPATLTVSVRPVVVRHPQGMTVAVGSNVTLQAGVNGGWPLTNRWRRGSANVYTNVLIAKQTNSTFLLANIQTNQAAGYSLGVVNGAGSSLLSSNAFVTVVVPPTNSTVMSGADARFTVQAFGLPRILYQWKAGNLDIPGATNTTLVLSNAQASQAGSYSVVVSAITNTAIAPATFSANLTVQGSPPVLSQPRLLSASEFQFLLTGDSNATYAVQFSSDLTNWTTFTNVSYTEPVTITDHPAPADSRRFYRARGP